MSFTSLSARAARSGLLLLGALSLSGCALMPWGSDRSVTPNSSTYYAPPPKAVKLDSAPIKPMEIPADALTRQYGLTEIIDYALKNNPATRAAWLDAKVAAAKAGVAEAGYYPKVNLNAQGGIGYLDRSDIDKTAVVTTLGPSVSLSWLVMDFGSRDANRENALLVLAAANWTQNRYIQDTILATQRAYYLYLASKSVRDARSKALERANLALTTARGRHEAGVVTIADVLAAETVVAQAQLALDSANGSIEITRGSLAVAMGLPSNVPFDVEALPAKIAYAAIDSDVQALIDEALKNRPDLLAARSTAAAARATARKTEAEGLPTLSLNAASGLNWIKVNDEVRTPANDDRLETSLSAGLLFTLPLFTGYNQEYSLERYRAEADAASERAKLLDQLAINQVFTAYHSLRTAAQKVKSSDALVRSAELAEDVAFGRYKEGVGTLLDLSTAQANLADARTQAIGARWEWHTALAQLAHDTGTIDLAGRSTLPALKDAAR